MKSQAAFADCLRRLLPVPLPDRIALAVSGGGDSVALMHMAAEFARDLPLNLHVLTVDHRLRPKSGAEAETVARAARALGLGHATLVWTGWNGQGNLQDAARTARRALIEDWCDAHGIAHVLTGHTADDQAETVLLRLARGSGVDGLAGMAAREVHGITWLRPMLGLRRADLRADLRDRGTDWADDPSNDDPRFDRVRARKMLAQLSDLGLTPARLLRTADHMAAARRSLRDRAADFARAHVIEDRGDLILPLETLDVDRGDTERRLFAAALCWIGQSGHRPRFAALQAAAARLRDGGRVTLHGVVMTPGRQGIRLSREAAAVAKVETPVTNAKTRWDGRWILSGPSAGGPATVRRLGESGLALCSDWRESGLPRMSLLASPAVWRGEDLVSAPLAGPGNGWTARIDGDFAHWLLSH